MTLSRGRGTHLSRGTERTVWPDRRVTNVPPFHRAVRRLGGALPIGNRRDPLHRAQLDLVAAAEPEIAGAARQGVHRSTVRVPLAFAYAERPGVGKPLTFSEIESPFVGGPEVAVSRVRSPPARGSGNADPAPDLNL